jgi:hypothetical protein
MVSVTLVVAMLKKRPSSKTPTTPIEPKASNAPVKTSTKTTKKKAKTKPAPAVTPAGKSTAAPPVPSQQELQTVLTYPMLTGADIKNVAHPAAGYETVAGEALTTWQSIADDFKVPGLSIEALQTALATRNTLSPIELKIVPFLDRARANRIKADSDSWTILLALVRAVKGAGSPELAARFATLINWIAVSRSPKKPAKKKTTTTKTA